ncbi:hypothetical protein [Heyndrickxia oleronia]|uniref:hypothetical protein n=1 Tax=Heyndrickxia oleronia TaxID=38875 RepID=UPI001C0EDB18|nr:hypothetical protein [Heyndrickxia oleronia]MBU5213263.1 hypothetical protein [Heyndrickxia oleronia]
MKFDIRGENPATIVVVYYFVLFCSFNSWSTFFSILSNCLTFMSDERRMDLTM